MKINKIHLLISFFTITLIISAFLVIKDIIVDTKTPSADLNNTTSPNQRSLIEEIERLNTSEDLEEDNKQEAEEELSVEEKRQQTLEKLRKRYSLRAVVIKGDFYNSQNDPEKALDKYLEAYKQLPDDESIIQKIADLYYNEKDYSNAYTYYFKIKDEDDEILDKLVLSLFYSEKLETIEDLEKTAFIIKNDIPLNKDGKFYYINSLACLSDFHLCKKNFNSYFEKNPELNYDKLQKIKDTIKQYQDFKIDELYYKDTLLTAAFFENGLYPVSAKVGEEILESKPNYQSIMQIIGKSYFELQDFEKSKEILEKSYELDPTNPKISYLLGIINFNLGDYESSSLYYNAALKSGYSPKDDLERRLAYNYYILEDTENMLSTFTYLLSEDDAQIEDFSLGIYQAIVNNKKTLALKWANTAKNKFIDEELFYGYLGWIYRELNNNEMAEEILNQGLEKNGRNPLITLNLGYLYLSQGDMEKAETFFKRTYLINSDGEFGILAQNELKNIENFTNE